ncbi:hypothetical protein ACQUQP_19655 [Marinobacterium sp. YM272]|uniref:hypothetical protein n=1 Tax=Marinobacterium sp. YM272 TaxID=3421654 RepID=UPI003D7F285A
MKLLTSIFAVLLLSVVTLVQATELQTGSVAIYSNGQVKKLVEQTPDWTLWESARKRLYRLSFLPYFPTLEYQRFPRERGGYTRHIDLTKVPLLMPFGDSKSIAFISQRTKTDGTSAQRHWRCRYDGKARESLMEREWLVENYSCNRFNPFSKKPFKERREISYAPDLGMVVKESVSRPGRQIKVTRLEYLLNPKEANANLIADMVKGLRH